MIKLAYIQHPVCAQQSPPQGPSPIFGDLKWEYLPPRCPTHDPLLIEVYPESSHGFTSSWPHTDKPPWFYPTLFSPGRNRGCCQDGHFQGLSSPILSLKAPVWAGSRSLWLMVNPPALLRAAPRTELLLWADVTATSFYPSNHSLSPAPVSSPAYF